MNLLIELINDTIQMTIETLGELVSLESTWKWILYPIYTLLIVFIWSVVWHFQ